MLTECQDYPFREQRGSHRIADNSVLSRAESLACRAIQLHQTAGLFLCHNKGGAGKKKRAPSDMDDARCNGESDYGLIVIVIIAMVPLVMVAVPILVMVMVTVPAVVVLLFLEMIAAVDDVQRQCDGRFIHSGIVLQDARLDVVFDHHPIACTIPSMIANRAVDVAEFVFISHYLFAGRGIMLPAQVDETTIALTLNVIDRGDLPNARAGDAMLHKQGQGLPHQPFPAPGCRVIHNPGGSFTVHIPHS